MRKSQIFAFCCLPFLLGWQGLGPVADAAELAVIKQRRYLIVAVKDNLSPLGFRNNLGQLEGLEIDIARRLAQELLGRQDAVQFQSVSNQDRIAAVLDGQVDLAIASITVTGPRARLISFSTPYYVNGVTLITAQPAIQRWSDLATRRIAVLEGSGTIAVVRYFLPRAQLITVESYAAGQALLESDQAVAFAGDASVLSGWVREFPQYRLLPTLLSAEPFSIVMPKGVQYDDLRQQVNAAIARWEKEGWLQDRATYWGLPWATLEREPQRTQPAPALSLP